MSKKHDQQEPIASRKTLKLIDEHVGLDKDEQVLLMERKHWHIFRNSLFVGLFIPFVLFSLLGLVYLGQLNWSPAVMRWVISSIVAISTICFVVGLVRFLWHFHMWKHTFYVMTNKKLAIINRYKPWSYEAQQINLNNINDVTVRQEGMEAFLYHYSDVIAVTFSGSTFVFEEVGHAVAVQKAIMAQLALQDRPAIQPQTKE